VQLKAEVVSTGVVIGTATIFVRAGWGSYVEIEPAPR
jgi:hypothetical protein